MGMSCSIVMVSYRTGAALRHAVQRALAQEGLAELVLVDNGNPPETLSALPQDARLKIITGQGNIGFARGCNMGAGAATGEYILLLNPDCLLPEGALARGMQALAEHPEAWAAGCLLLNADGTEQRGGRRELLTPETAWREALGRGGLNRNEAPLPSETHEIPAISGAFMLLPRARWEELSGMDEGYFLHVEDLDLCMRIHRAGGKILCVPQIEVIHLLSTSDAPSAFVEWHKAQGFTRYFRQHFIDRPKPLLAALALGAYARMALRVARAAGKRHAAPSATARAGLQMLQVLEAAAPSSPSFAGKRVLVAGARSLVAPFAMGRLAALGAEIRVHTRGGKFVSPLPCIRRWEHKESADAVVYCAPLWTLPDALERYAALGIRRIVAFGSTSVFGKSNSNNAEERRTARILRLSEENIRLRAQALGMGITILRPTLIYGAGLDGNVTRIARTLRRFRLFPIYPPADGLRQPVHADDLAAAAVACLETAETEGKTYNLGGGETLAYRAMAERIAAACGVRARLLPVPFLPKLLDALGRLRHNAHVTGAMATRMNEDLVFSYDDAARDFGYTPRAFLSAGMADITGVSA